MRNIFTLAVSEQDPPCHGDVQKGVREETLVPGGGLGPKSISDNLIGIWYPTCLCITIKINGVGADCVRQLLGGGCCEYDEGTSEVGSDVEDIGLVGFGIQDLCHILQGNSACSTLVRLGDLGDDPLDQLNPGGFQPQCGPPAEGYSVALQFREEMGVSTIGGGNVDSGTGGGGDVRPLPPKHYSPIYLNSFDIGYVSEDIEVTGSACGQYMVGAGRFGLVGIAVTREGISKGGGSYGRTGRWRQDKRLSWRG